MSSPVRLGDGRHLDVQVGGADEGLPLVFHHGTPGAATPFRALERAARERSLRLVTTSRPGYGSSSRHPGRSVVDVADDIASVLANMGIERCLVAGWSGGGPHALACAARLEAAAAVLVIAGLAPHRSQGLDWMAEMGRGNVTEFNTALQGEEALRPYLDEQRTYLEGASVRAVVSSLRTVLPEADRAVVGGEFGEDLAAGMQEGLREGVDGWLDDDLAFTKPWGFSLEEISIPTMLWHGTADLMVPVNHGQWLSSRLACASLHVEPDEGHLSLASRNFGRMLDELVMAGL